MFVCVYAGEYVCTCVSVSRCLCVRAYLCCEFYSKQLSEVSCTTKRSILKYQQDRKISRSCVLKRLQNSGTVYDKYMNFKTPFSVACNHLHFGMCIQELLHTHTCSNTYTLTQTHAQTHKRTRYLIGVKKDIIIFNNVKRFGLYLNICMYNSVSVSVSISCWLTPLRSLFFVCNLPYPLQSNRRNFGATNILHSSLLLLLLHVLPDDDCVCSCKQQSIILGVELFLLNLAGFEVSVLRVNSDCFGDAQAYTRVFVILKEPQQALSGSG